MTYQECLEQIQVLKNSLKALNENRLALKAQHDKQIRDGENIQGVLESAGEKMRERDRFREQYKAELVEIEKLIDEMEEKESN
jgi:hypothetical protein